MIIDTYFGFYCHKNALLLNLCNISIPVIIFVVGSVYITYSKCGKTLEGFCKIEDLNTTVIFSLSTSTDIVLAC